jgi:AraC-like DNA-binding protein
MKKLEGPDFIYRIEVSESLRTLYHSFFSYLKQENKIPQKIIELKFREMLLNICGDRNNPDFKDVLYTIYKNLDGSIEQVMEEQFIYNLQIEEFARLCGRSLSTFKREFKRIYNSTPGKWLLKKRLELARSLMLSTDLTVQEICYDCGFESDSHFVRSFKNQFGNTPNQWRLARSGASI